MAESFADAYRHVKLHVPDAPVFLCREWVDTAWKTLARSRSWGFLRGEMVLQIAAARSVAVTVTQGLAAVTSAGLFLASDESRQFRVLGLPVYTIQSVVDPTTILLDRVYGEDTATPTAQILDNYAVMPADFGSFRLIPDRYNQRRLPFWITEDQLNLLDPARLTSDIGPRALVSIFPSRYTGTLGRLQYEYWPKPTAARSYPAMYNKQAAALTDATVFTGVLADAREVLEAGALALAASWPGTSDRPNPYFNRSIHQDKQLEFVNGMQVLSLKDDNQYPDDLASVHWNRWPLSDLAFNDQALRATDATVADLY